MEGKKILKMLLGQLITILCYLEKMEKQNLIILQKMFF